MLNYQVSSEEAVENRLISCALAAHKTAISIYNGPYAEYALEGYCILIINAWELSLKAYLIKRGISEAPKPGELSDSITICIGRVTNLSSHFLSDSVLANLKSVVGLRNEWYHFPMQDVLSEVWHPLLEASSHNLTAFLQNEFRAPAAKLAPPPLRPPLSSEPLPYAAAIENALEFLNSQQLSTTLLEEIKKEYITQANANKSNFYTAHVEVLVKFNSSKSGLPVHINNEKEGLAISTLPYSQEEILERYPYKFKEVWEKVKEEYTHLTYNQFKAFIAEKKTDNKDHKWMYQPLSISAVVYSNAFFDSFVHMPKKDLNGLRKKHSLKNDSLKDIV